MAYVELRNISKWYQGNTVVHDVNLKIEQGEFVSLLGPSGCGKTTTLRMLAGFVEPTAGEIYMQDKPLYSKIQGINIPPEKRHIGMVFQSYAVWPHMTVFENIAYPLKLRKTHKNEISAKVSEGIELVNLTGLEKRYPSELSGGQQQRVAIARAVVMKPALLLLDEPLSSLDAKLREKMYQEINAIWRRTGITVVYVTHDQKEAMALSDTIVLMKHGEIIQRGSPCDIYERPANYFCADFIGKANILQGIATVRGDSGIMISKDMFLPVEYIKEAEEGRNATFLFRPEHVRIIPEQVWNNGCHTGYSGLAGTITYRSYFGSYMEYGININYKTEIRAESNTQNLLEPGDKVFITIHKAITVQERED
ncbi:MAG: ABC transporter ATP-binding protein [Desulfosporosinus sp.]|nr:ABC transporter ATP-binding protein [Desulfosporosinus sp.]